MSDTAFATAAPQTDAPVAEHQVEEVQSEAKIEDIDYSAYSKKELYSPRDIAIALDFAQRWNAASSDRREVFSNVMDVYGDQADIILGLIPSNGRVNSIEFIQKIYVKNTDETMSRAQIREWGMELAATISDMDVDSIRSVVKMINALAPGDDIRYRRNMSSIDVVNAISDKIDAFDSNTVSTLNWICSMVSVWPGQIQ